MMEVEERMTWNEQRVRAINEWRKRQSSRTGPWEPSRLSRAEPMRKQLTSKNRTWWCYVVFARVVSLGLACYGPVGQAQVWRGAAHARVCHWLAPGRVSWTACVAYTCPSNPRIPTVVRSCHGMGSVASRPIVMQNVSQQITRLTMVLSWTPRAKFGFPRADAHGLVPSRVSGEVQPDSRRVQFNKDLPCLHPPSLVHSNSTFFFLI